MDTFTVDFKQAETSLSLQYQVLDTPIAARWYSELKDQINLNPRLKGPDRMYNFDNGVTTETLFQRLNTAIDGIHKWRAFLRRRPTLPLDRDAFNRLRKHFEQMRGGILSPGKIWSKAPTVVKAHIEDFNNVLHHMECHGTENLSFIVLSFLEKTERRPFQDADYDEFSLDSHCGTAYINYNEVGKPLFDAFLDNDTYVAEDNIRPLGHYSPDLFLCFYNRTMAPVMPRFWQWWDDNAAMMERIGLQKNDKKLALGRIPVAKIVGPMDRIVEQLSQFTCVDGIRL